MGLKLKSKQNRKIAEVAYLRNYFDVACSRYYYSMLQYLLYLFEKLSFTKKERIRSVVKAELSLKRKNFGGTHIQIMYYYKYLLRNKPQIAQDFQNLFTSVKNLRVTADYHNVALDAEDVKNMKVQIKKLKKIVDDCIITAR